MTETIDADLVRHVGRLSRIELSEEEVAVFRRQLAAILEYFGKLQELNTDSVEPLVHPVELSNVLADDTPAPGLTTDQALANAPARDGALFQVPRVIGDSQ